MNLSEDRQSHLAHVIIDGLWNDDLVDYTDEDAALRMAKQAVVKWVQEEMNVDELIRKKIETLKRQVIENTPEWDIMYKKYYEEEMRKRGQG